MPTVSSALTLERGAAGPRRCRVAPAPHSYAGPSTLQSGSVNRAIRVCHGLTFPEARHSSLPRLRRGVRLSVKTVRLRRATFEEDIEGFLHTNPREGRFSTAVVVLALWAAIMPL